MELRQGERGMNVRTLGTLLLVTANGDGSGVPALWQKAHSVYGCGHARAPTHKRAVATRAIALLLGLIVSVLCVKLVFLRYTWLYVPSPTAASQLRLGYSARMLPFLGLATRASTRTPEDFLAIASSVDVITICHPDWHGIRAATYAQDHLVLEMPGILSEGHFQRILEVFGQLPALTTVIVNGIPPSSIHLAARLRQAMPDLQILFVYHGAPSNLVHEYEAGLVDALLEAALNGTVNRLGLVKNGLAPWLRTLGIRAQTIWNFPSLPHALPMDAHSQRDERFHVGLFGTGTIAKNVLTQLLALCALDNVVIHVVELPHIPYVRRCAAPIVEHGFMTHETFVRELGRMDLNLYISLSECFPMVVLESVAAGVPCITSATSMVYDVDEVLHELLVVDELDSPSAITRAVEVVLTHLPELVPRLKGLLQWLHAKARLEWERFVRGDEQLPPLVGAPYQKGALAQHLAEAVGRMQDEDALSERPNDPRLPYTPLVSNKRPYLHEAAEEVTVCLVTYELAPVNGGGEGTVATALVQELLAHGHGVVMLAYMPCGEVEAWIRFINDWRTSIQKAARALFSVYCVPRLLEFLNAEITPTASAYLLRSREIAAAARYAYQRTPFDILEVFDYVGIGFEIMRNRRAHAQHEGGLAVTAEQASLEAGNTPYIGMHVPIVVRLHGTMQLIEQASAVASTDADTRLMFLMEQYGLEIATMLLGQSNAMSALYARVYGLTEDRFVLAPPPMERVLSMLDDPMDGRTAPAALRSGIQEVLARCSDRQRCKRVLVLGRLSAVKGTETVAKALQLLFQTHRNDDVHAVFVGDSARCSLHQQEMAKCVRAQVAEQYWHRITMLPSVSHSDLRWLVDTLDPRVAVVASEFETFSMVAHELTYLHVPLVISDIPAFREFFAANNSFPAQPGNEESFATALRDALSDHAKIAAIRANDVGSPNYGDPMSAYMHRVTPQDEVANLRRPLPLLERAIRDALTVVDRKGGAVRRPVT